MSKTRGPKEGSIYQEDGRWVASVTVGYAFKDGKRRRIRKKFSGPTRGEVAERLTAALRQQHTGQDISPNTRTVGWFLNYWIKEVVEPDPTAKPKTVEFYTYIVTTHLIPSVASIKLEKFTPAHVQALLNDKRKSISERTNKPLSERTVDGIARTLHTALQVAVAYGFATRNVAALRRTKKGTGNAEAKPEAKFLQLDQAQAMLASAAQEPLYYALFACVLSLGLRLGEALGLAWSDVDFAGARLHVRHTLQRVKAKHVLLNPKSKRSTRTIDLPAVTVTALQEHVRQQQQAREWAGEDWKGNELNLIFTSPTGAPLDERNALRIFQEKILKRAGLPKMRVHDLRHSAAAILIAQGVDARSISELLGHSSVGFTLQVYGHLLDQTKRETAAKMDAALAPPAAVAPSLAPLAPRDTVN